jgi:undecaprenyl-diphosphatase
VHGGLHARGDLRLDRWIADRERKADAKSRQSRRRVAGRQCLRPWVARVRARFATQLDFLGRRLRPRGAFGLSLTLALVAIVAAGWLFGAVLEDAMTGNGIGSIDAIAVTYLAEHRTAWLTSLMRGITAFGGSAVALPLVILAGGLAASRTHRWQNLAAAVVTALGANLLSRLVKVLVHRPRPPVALAEVHPDQYAFPSGHAITAVVAYGTIAYLACRALPRWRSRVAVWTGAAAIMALVGMSRVYLGAHWPSDVVGGWALGALWLGLAYTAITALAHAGSPHSGGGGDHTEDRAGVAPRR